MKIENLKEGMVIKNYKELCKLLGIKVSDGNSKKKQLEELGHYCEYTKEGHKFVIHKIDENPVLKLEDILKTKNSKYIKLLSNIILEYLYKNEESLKEIRLIKLFSMLGMTNENYQNCESYKFELGQMAKVQTFSVYYFYSNTRNEYKKIIERCLNNLQKRSVLFWKRCVVIVNKDETTHKASKEEEEFILDTQRNVLTNMGYSDMYTLMQNFKDLYKFNKIVEKELGFNYYFAYDITIGKRAIEIEYNETFKTEMNKLMIDKTQKMFSGDFFQNHRNDYQKLINILTDIEGTDEELGGYLKSKHMENETKHKSKSNSLTNEYLQEMNMLDREFKDPYKII